MPLYAERFTPFDVFARSPRMPRFSCCRADIFITYLLLLRAAPIIYAMAMPPYCHRFMRLTITVLLDAAAAADAAMMLIR